MLYAGIFTDIANDLLSAVMILFLVFMLAGALLGPATGLRTRFFDFVEELGKAWRGERNRNEDDQPTDPPATERS